MTSEPIRGLVPTNKALNIERSNSWIVRSPTDYQFVTSTRFGSFSASRKLRVALFATCGNAPAGNRGRVRRRKWARLRRLRRELLLEKGFCGDGILERKLGEQCEPTLMARGLPYTCDGRCHILSPHCSDGKADPGEKCDDASPNSIAGRSLPRELLARCDDGNTLMQMAAPPPVNKSA